MNEITSVNAVLQRSTELENAGSWEEAISMLTQRNLQKENIEIESRLIKVRRRAFNAHVDSAPSAPELGHVADMFPDEKGVPDVQASELTAAVIASAMQHHGALMVRGAVGEEDAEKVNHAIDATLDARASLGDPSTDFIWPWYKPNKLPGDPPLGFERSVTEGIDMALIVDTPRTLFRHLEAMARGGLIDTIKEYYGEAAAISARKTVIRRLPPDVDYAWHQDGIYFGDTCRVLNVWTAYSPCGVDAAGLDILARPFDRALEADDERFFNQSLTHDTVTSFGEDHIVRPVFNTGDAIVFDGLTMHRTGVDKDMTKSRKSIEMWCFAASTFPDNHTPLFI
jgi:hypothetical protein